MSSTLPTTSAADAPVSSTAGLKILAGFYILVGALGLILGTVFFVHALPDPQYPKVFAAFFPLFAILAALIFVPSLAGGIGLLLAKRWARAVILALSCVLLLAIPVGTALAVYSFWVLCRPQSNRYFNEGNAGSVAAVESLSPRLKFRDLFRRYVVPQFAVAGVAAGFVVIIGSGYRLHGQTMPREIAMFYVPAIAVFVLALGALGVKGFHLARRRFQRAALRMTDEEQEQLERQYQADNRRRDAYVADCSQLATCEHLQPVERAMREASITLVPLTGRNVGTHQRAVDVEAYCRLVTLANCVHIVSIEDDDRGVLGPPTTLISCGVCESSVFVYYPVVHHPMKG